MLVIDSTSLSHCGENCGIVIVFVHMPAWFPLSGRQGTNLGKLDSFDVTSCLSLYRISPSFPRSFSDHKLTHQQPYRYQELPRVRYRLFFRQQDNDTNTAQGIIYAAIGFRNCGAGCLCVCLLLSTSNVSHRRYLQ